MYPSLGVRRMYLRVVRMTFGLSRPWPVYPNTTALYPVPVRRIRVAAFASFRSHLAVGTLARPCGSCHLGPRRTYTSWIHNMPGAPREKRPHRGPLFLWIRPIFRNLQRARGDSAQAQIAVSRPAIRIRGATRTRQQGLGRPSVHSPGNEDSPRPPTTFPGFTPLP